MRLFLPALGLATAIAVAGVVLDRPGAAHAGTARRMTVENMVDAADVIVQAEVLSARSRVGARGIIETEYVLDVSQTFWGQPLSTRVVRLPGGVLPDGRGLVLSGMPELHKGDEALLFLTRASASGIRMPVGLAQGKFELERQKNGSLQLTREIVGLALSNPTTGKVEEAPRVQVFDYAAIVAQVRAAASARTAREKTEQPAREE